MTRAIETQVRRTIRAVRPQDRFAAAVTRTKGRGVFLAYYTGHPITGQWACRWCRTPLQNNRVECPCWKGLKE